MRITLLALLIIILSFNGIAQTQYYVSVNGNDNNSGINLQNPWRSIQYAMDNATPNSVVNIQA
jgi:hypothetical protein